MAFASFFYFHPKQWNFNNNRQKKKKDEFDSKLISSVVSKRIVLAINNIVYVMYYMVELLFDI